ncbi:YdcH family protein [Methylobacterium sp. A54F]
MSLQTHLSQLTRKHEALEREIQEAIHRPAEDDLRIAELKRRKLHLKDEINRLQASADTIH